MVFFFCRRLVVVAAGDVPGAAVKSSILISSWEVLQLPLLRI